MSTPSLQIVLTAQNLTGNAFAQLRKDVGGVMSPIRDLKGMLLGLGAGIGFGALAKGFLDTGIYMDRMARALSSVQGGAKPAQESIKYLREESERLGVVFKDQIQGFLLFSAATKGTALAGEQTKQMYSDLMESVASFQLTQEDAYQSVRAVQQMLNKGSIQAEEFRGQFGERIPAAFEALKRLLQVNDKTLGEMMKKGQLYSSAVVPGLLRMMALMNKAGLNEVTQSAQSEINRMKNSWADFQKLVMDSGVTESLASGLRELAEEFSGLMKENEKAIEKFIKGALDGIKTLKTPITQIYDTFSNMWNTDWSRTTFAYSGLALIALMNRRMAAIWLIAEGILFADKQIKAFGAVAGGGLTLKQGFGMTPDQLDAHLEAMRSTGPEFEKFAVQQSQVRMTNELTQATKDLAEAKKRVKSYSVYAALTPFEDQKYLDSLNTAVGEMEDKVKSLKATIERSKEIKPVGQATVPIPDELRRSRMKEFIERQIIEEQRKVKEELAKIEGQTASKTSKSETAAQNRMLKAREHIANAIAKFERDEMYQIDVTANKYSEKEKRIRQVSAAVENLNERLQQQAKDSGVSYDPKQLQAVQARLMAAVEKEFAPDTEGAMATMKQHLAEMSEAYDDELSAMLDSSEVKAQKESAKLVKSFNTVVKQVQKDYRVTEDYSDMLDELQEKLNQLRRLNVAKGIGESFADGFLEGFHGGMGSLGDILARSFENVAFDTIGKKVTAKIQSFVTSGTNAVIGEAIGSVAGGFMGAGINMIGSGLVDKITGSSRKAERAALHAWYKAVRANTEATDRNTYKLNRGEKSSYTGGVLDLGQDFKKTKSDIIANFHSSGLSVDSMVWKSIAQSKNIFSGSIQEVADRLKEGADVITNKKISLKLRELSSAFGELAANIDAMQRQIMETARSAWVDAGDAFRSEAEIQKRETQKAGRDILVGLAETFQLEGGQLRPTWKDVGMGVQVPQERVIDDAYIDALAKLGSVQEVSQKLLGDLIPGTDAYNQAMEASLVIYETGRMKFQSMQSEILTSARDMYEGAADGFRSEAAIQKRELEKQGKEFLVGLAETYSFDQSYIDNLKSLGSVQEVSQKLLGSLTQGTTEYNQVMETSLLLYETGILKQQDYMKGLNVSISDWRKELEQRKWGLPEWVTEFESIGKSIQGLNTLSDSYFSDAVSLAEDQFDALKQIVSLSEAQLVELQNSSKSLEQQLWEFTKGGESDTVSIKDWMARGESLYSKASETLSSEDISAFQNMLPELKDAMLAGGYSYSYVTDQFKWALNSLLSKVNGTMETLDKSIGQLPSLAPTVQPIQISLKIDGRELSNVIIDQLNSNSNLIKAVQRVTA